VIGDRCGQHEPLRAPDVFRRHARRQHRQVAQGGAFDNLDFLRLGRVIEMQRKHETIQLRFRQRISAFLFDRILGGDDQEGIRQGAGLAAHRHAVFLHGLEQRGLGFGRRAIDFIGQKQIGKDGARLVLELEATILFLQHFRPNDIRRHEIGGELHATEGELHGVAQRADEQRLGQARHPDEQAVPAGKKAGEQQLDNSFLADDDAAQFLADALVEFTHLRWCDVVHALRGSL
jgi:hypothetical protein